MNTAMQELIDYVTDKFGSNNDVANDIACQAMILKKKEKQQIIDAFEIEIYDDMGNVNVNCEDLYNKTFDKE